MSAVRSIDIDVAAYEKMAHVERAKVFAQIFGFGVEAVKDAARKASEKNAAPAVGAAA